MKHKLAITIIVLIVLSIIVYGIALPFLISYPSDLLVGLGILGGTIYTYLLVVKIINLIKSINQ